MFSDVAHPSSAKDKSSRKGYLNLLFQQKTKGFPFGKLFCFVCFREMGLCSRARAASGEWGGDVGTTSGERGSSMGAPGEWGCAVVLFQASGMCKSKISRTHITSCGSGE